MLRGGRQRGRHILSRCKADCSAAVPGRGGSVLPVPFKNRRHPPEHVDVQLRVIGLDTRLRDSVCVCSGTAQ